MPGITESNKQNYKKKHIDKIQKNLNNKDKAAKLTSLNEEKTEKGNGKSKKEAK
ncbi:MAG: hypothetical protein WDZ80_07500 [Candidatus Paceibacterota bacterium]